MEKKNDKHQAAIEALQRRIDFFRNRGESDTVNRLEEQMDDLKAAP